jgi:hypothetical protein
MEYLPRRTIAIHIRLKAPILDPYVLFVRQDILDVPVLLVPAEAKTIDTSLDLPCFWDAFSLCQDQKATWEFPTGANWDSSPSLYGLSKSRYERLLLLRMRPVLGHDQTGDSIWFLYAALYNAPNTRHVMLRADLRTI